MAQPPRRANSATESRRRNMESSSHSNSMVNGVGSVKPKVSRSSPEANSSPYSQSVASVGKSVHGSDLARRRSQKDKPAIPVKPPLSNLPPPKVSRTNGTTTTVTTTTIHSKSQSQVVGTCSNKRDVENRMNGSESKKNGDLNGDAKSSNGKGKVCLEITLEKKTPSVRRKANDHDAVRSTASSSEESSPSQSPTKSVHFKSSRSNSASSLDSRDRLRLSSTPGSQPRYQSHTISSADKTKGRTRSAAGRTGLETNGDTQLNGSSSSTSVEPIRRSRARSVGPIRRVRSNEMMSCKRDPSLSPKSGTISTTQVRSRSVERSRNRQSFGGFVQRQRQAWEERSVTTVTKRHQLDNVSEKGNRRSVDPNHAPKIMQKSVTVTERKHMLFGKGANVQKVKSTIDGNQVSKPTSPTLLHKSDASHQVPKTKSSSSDAESHTSKKTEASGRAASKGSAQGDNVSCSDQTRTCTVDNSSEKSTVLQEIAPAPSSKPNAPNSLPIKPVYQNADSNYRVSPSKENKLDSLVTDIDVFAGNAADETDNGKINLFIDEHSLGHLGKPDSQRCKPQSSNHQEGYAEILSLTDPKEINKLNSGTVQSHKKVDNTFVEVDKKDVKKDLAKEKEKAGISNGEDVGEKDGHYFLRVVNEEQSRIEALCRKVEDDLECEMTEEVSGICRAFLGKANLLTSKKFKQFRGLCEQNITHTPSPEVGRNTLASDLAGFWDMVMIQVDEINAKFISIDAMKQNNWQIMASPKVTKAARKTPIKRSYGRQVSRDKDDKSGQGAVDSNKNNKKDDSRAAKLRAAREEARKRLIAAKKQAARQRIKSNTSETEVEIFTASSPSQ